jgi:hypothetical protein|tara:strand:+ start:494 stop:706 length:213 start_codon:yes stop_codon:yes gene_type:complete
MLKVLLNIIETLVPVAGEVVENVKSKDGGVGRFFAPRFVKQMIRLLVAAGAIYMMLSGKIGIDEFKDVVE